MSRIRAKDTKPEMLVRRYLHSRGFRYRLNVRRLPGTPDIVLRKYKTAIFIHGCFWHGHEGCRLYVPPKSNTHYWTEKIARNIERDTIACAKLHQLGWHTVVIWECQLKPHERDNTLSHPEYILSTTYLNDRRTNRPKPYVTPEEQQIYMAAEEMP
jgi:DNA mismatch endonuclease (patch repair protein)